MDGFGIDWFIRASQGYREVLGSNLNEVLNFSDLYIRSCINCVHNCEDHSLLGYLYTLFPLTLCVSLVLELCLLSIIIEAIPELCAEVGRVSNLN